MALAPGETLAHYRITAAIGAGGMGEVYRATDTKLGREVAIKVLPSELEGDPERLVRFEREAKLLASLNHPNIAHVYGFESATLDGGLPAHFLAMELVEGEELAERLKRGPIPLGEAIEIAKQIAEALEEAHEHGIVHRDLKPANVKLTADGKVKVLDFGLAKAYAGESATGSGPDLSQSPTLARTGTQAGVILGTAAYMAPEQARGKPVDKRADIWAFGVVLFEMLTGKRLFMGETTSDVLAAVLRQEIDFTALPTEPPPAIHRLLRGCLDRNPRNRLHDIADARIAIEETLGGGGVVEAGPAEVPARSRRLPWAIAAVCALIAIGSLLALLFGRAAAQRSSRSAPTRTSILLPGSAVVGSGFALSPDGDAVVYLASTGAGRPRLLVRELTSLEARPLEGTEGADLPFWSPDSRHIGFFAAGELRRVPRAGGAVQDICAAKAGRGGAWSPDGTIVFAPEPYGPLWKVRASGGEPTPATKLDDDQEKKASHRFPVFLPDGLHFLFIESGPKGGDAVLVASTAETGAGRRLFEAGSSPRFAAPDWLVFERAGALVAQRIDLDRLEMIGEPRQLADRPSPARTAQAPVVDLSSGDRMLYVAADPRPSRFVWLDRTGRRLEEGMRVEGSAYGLSVSHRGDRVAVFSRTTDSRTALWLVEPSRKGALRLTPPALFPWGVAWAADDRSIFAWMGSVRGDSMLGSLSAISVDGGGVRSLLPISSRWILPTDASADGKRLLLSELTTDRGRDIVWIPIDAAGEERAETTTYLATPANEDSGKLSPDGRWIVYLSDASGRPEAYLDRFPAPAGQQRIAAGGAAGGVFFRNDGRELFVLAADGDADALFACDLRLGERAEIGPPRKLFRLPAGYLVFAAAPSGERFVIAEPEGERWPSLTLVEDWTAQLVPEKR